MIDEAIYSILTTNSQVAAIVSTRVFPVVLPQQSQLPALAYARVSTIERSMTHSGPSFVSKVVYQVSCFANGAKAAKELAGKVYRAMHGYAGSVGSEKIYYVQCVNEVEAFEHETGIYQVPLDMLIMHKDV